MQDTSVRKKRRFRLSMSAKRALKGYMFILPWLVGFLFFYGRSLFMTGQFALSKLSLNPTGGYTLDWTGLDNFFYAFRSHASFKQVLTTSLMNIVIDVPLIIFFSILVSMMLNRRFRGRSLLRVIFFLPVILNADAVVDAMQMAAQLMSGGLKSVSSEVADGGAMGSTVNVGYYMNLFADIAIPSALLNYIVGAVSRISDIIQGSGVQIVIFIAALQSIPTSLYEVARIEGATAYETFWKITFPLLMPHIITNTVYTIVVRFSESDIVQLAYTTAFTEQNWGLSSAFSLISTLIVCAMLALVTWWLTRHTFYYN